MKIIDKFKKHPKYEAALAIVRAKITGPAADELTNNKTPYNIICILKTLDAAYRDQRPLYAIEAQMMAIKQGDKSLQQFYNAVNFSLNAIITKIVMTYKDIKEQRSLIYEAQKKAIRTFIVGLKFRVIRHILYGHQPKSLASAYAIAQTVFYDNEHLQLEQGTNFARGQPQQRGMNNWNQQAKDKGIQPRNDANWNQPRNNAQPANWRKAEPRQCFEQPQKMQRINHLTDETIQNDSVSNDANDYDNSPCTEMSSAFLEE